MPYLQETDEDELKKQQEAQSGTPTNISGQSSVLSTEAPSKAGGPQASGSFTNLNQYLQANASNAVQLGQGVASHITGQGEEARTGIQNTENDFNKLADQGTLQGLDKAPEEARSIVQQAQTGSQKAQINQQQTSRFGEIANATYKGPQDLTGSSYYNDTNQKYQKAQEAKQNASSDEGRFSLLKNAFSRPTYSQGQQNLDNLLLTGNNQAKATVQSAANGLSDLEGKWAGAQSNAAQLASQRQAATNAARAQSRTNALQAQYNRNTEVNSDLNAKQANWANEYNQYRDLLGSYKGGDFNLTRQQADRLALKDSGQGIYNTLQGTSPEQFLDLQAFDANRVVDQDQFAQLRALDQITNQFSSPAMSRFTDESQAGTLDATKAFDASRFGQAANQAESNFQNTAANTNLDARGYNDQSWYGGGILNNDKHWVNAAGQATGNVKDYLDNGNFTINGKQANTKQAGAIDITPTNDIMSTLYGDALRSGIGWGGSGAQGIASNDAQVAANQQATQGYFDQLNNFLNQQGHKNRTRIT